MATDERDDGEGGSLAKLTTAGEQEHKGGTDEGVRLTIVRSCSPQVLGASYWACA